MTCTPPWVERYAHPTRCRRSWRPAPGTATRWSPGSASRATASARGARESIEVRESTTVVLGDIQNKRVVRCSLDSCLSLSSFFARSAPLKLPSSNTDLYTDSREERPHGGAPGRRPGSAARPPRGLRRARVPAEAGGLRTTATITVTITTTITIITTRLLLLLLLLLLLVL